MPKITPGFHHDLSDGECGLSALALTLSPTKSRMKPIDAKATSTHTVASLVRAPSSNGGTSNIRLKAPTARRWYRAPR